VPHRVSMAQSKMIHHRSADFGELFSRVLEGLKYAFQTKNDIVVFASSGTGGLEAAVANCFSPGDKVAVFSGGKFGERFVEISKFFGLDVIEVAYEWGECANPSDCERVVAENPDLKGVMLTHSETSTGVVNDVEAFGKIVGETQALFVVDTISGLCAAPFKTDEWSVDVAVGGSQKGLMTPPGLAFVSVSEKAWQVVEKAKLPRYYFCFKAARKSFSKTPPQTPYTPAITLLQALDEAIKMIQEEGLEEVWARHALFARATRAGVEALGLELFAKDVSRASVVTSVVSPGDINSGDLVRLLRNRYGIFIAGGQSKLKGKIFRLGHVGYFDRYDIIVQLAAVEFGLKELGYHIELGSGVTAAMRVLHEG